MTGKPRGGSRAAPAPKLSERSQRALARAEASQRGTQEDAHAKGKRTATQCRDGEGSQEGGTKRSRREGAEDKQTQTDATTDAAPQPDTSHYDCPICMDLLIAPVVSPCGHDFCQHCYEGMMTTSGSRVMCHVKCPICREPLPDRLPGVCKRLENTIEQLFPQQLAARRAILADELEERAKDRERAAQAQRAQRGENMAFAEVLETIHQLSQAAREGMGGASYGPVGEGAEDAAQRAARQPWSSFYSGYMPGSAPRPNMGERVRSLFTRGGQPAVPRAQPPPQPPGAAAAAPAGPGTPGAGGHTLPSAPGDTTLWRRSVGVATRGMRALGRSSQAPVPRTAAHMEGFTTSEDDSSAEEQPPSGGMPGSTARDTVTGRVDAPPFAFGSMPYTTVSPPFSFHPPHPQGPQLVAHLPSGPHRWDDASRRFIPMSQPMSFGTQQASAPRILGHAQAVPVAMVPGALQQYRRLPSFYGGAFRPSTTVELPAQPLPLPQVPSSTVQLLVQASAGASAMAGQQPSPVPQGASVAGPAAFIPMNQQLVNGSFLVSGGPTPLPMPAGTGGTGVGVSTSPSFSFPTFTMGRVETRSDGRRRRRQPPSRRRSTNN